MNERRNFLKLASAAAIPSAAAILSSGVARAADDESAAEFLGAWNTIHTLGFPPGYFREYLSFGAGRVLHETNTFLHTHSNLDFSGFGMPNMVNGSDGIGSWESVAKGKIRVTFRKLLYDGARINFGDLLVTGESAKRREETPCGLADLCDGPVRQGDRQLRQGNQRGNPHRLATPSLPMQNNTADLINSPRDHIFGGVHAVRSCSCCSYFVRVRIRAGFSRHTSRNNH